MHHRRESDSPDLPGFEHERGQDDTAFAAVKHVLGLPVSTFVAVVTLIVALTGVWLAHDRAIAAEAAKQQQSEEKISKLEGKDEARTKQDTAVTAALARIETKLDDLKERVDGRKP